MQRLPGGNSQTLANVKQNTASLIFVPRGNNTMSNKGNPKQLNAARSTDRASLANLAAAQSTQKLTDNTNPPPKHMTGPSPSARPSSILGSLLLRSSASPDAFNVYNKKGNSGRRRGNSKGKTFEKKATSQGREQCKTAQSNSSSLVRNKGVADDGMLSVL